MVGFVGSAGCGVCVVEWFAEPASPESTRSRNFLGKLEPGLVGVMVVGVEDRLDDVCELGGLFSGKRIEQVSAN